MAKMIMTGGSVPPSGRKDKKGRNRLKIAGIVLAALIAIGGISSLGGENKSNEDANAVIDIHENSANNSIDIDETVEDVGDKSEMNVGQGYVEFCDVNVVENSIGTACFIVTANWTNYGTKSDNASFTISCEAYQNGRKLGVASLVANDAYDARLVSSKIYPGASTDVQYVFVLEDDSPVDVKIFEYREDPDSGVSQTFDVSGFSIWSERDAAEQAKKAEQERLEAEKEAAAQAKKAEQERLEAEKEATAQAKKAEQERAAAEKEVTAQAKKAEQERAAAEKEAAAQAKKAEQERAAAEKEATKKSETENSEKAPATSKTADYVLNTSSCKFHRPGCSSANNIDPANRKDVNMAREDVLAMGYDPCKRCNP